MKRPSQKRHISADWFAAGKTRNSLVYNRLKNRSGKVFAAGAFVNKRLNVSFCKNTATGGNRINCFVTGCKLVKTWRVGFEQSCHLVNKSSSTAGTSSVHALFNTAGKICNFCVFSAKLDHNVCLRNEFFYSSCGCNYFLNKRNIKPLRNRKTARTCNFYRNSIVLTQLFFNFFQSLCNNRDNCIANVCTMALIIAVNHFIVLIKTNDFYSCRANINTNTDWS